MKPIKVTATLVGSLAGDVPKLDALIERAMAHRCDPRAMGLPADSGEYHPDAVPIPIARKKVRGFPWSIPLCSWPIFQQENDRHEFVNKRFSADPSLLAPGQRGVFANNSGEFRSYRLPMRVRDCGRIVWFCMGRGAEIRRLLSHERSGVRYLGKKGSIGYGQVSGWTVEPVEEDWSWFAPSPGGIVLMRALPASAELPADLVGFRKWYGGAVAPYWNARFHVEIVEPC